MTDKEFELEVLSYTGKYPSFELKKFVIYYTTKKHFSTLKGFSLTRRLTTWFDPKRKTKFKEKMESKKETDSDQLYRYLGVKCKIIKDV